MLIFPCINQVIYVYVIFISYWQLIGGKFYKFPEPFLPPKTMCSPRHPSLPLLSGDKQRLDPNSFLSFMVFVELSLKITPRVALVAFVLFFERSNNAYLISTTILFCLHWKSNGCINEPSTSGKQKEKKCWQTQLINGNEIL